MLWMQTGFEGHAASNNDEDEALPIRGDRGDEQLGSAWRIA